MNYSRLSLPRAAENAWFYIASTFALAYTTTKLGIPRQDILFGNDLWCRLNHGDDAIVWTSIRQSGAGGICLCLV